MVTIENYEEYLMMAADGELDAAGQRRLAAFLATRPELAEEAAAWEAVRLQPDTTTVYANKNALLRKAPQQITLGWKIPAMAAAVLAAVILIPRLVSEHRQPQIVHQFTKPAILVPAIAPDTAALAIQLAAPVPARRSFIPAMRAQIIKADEKELPKLSPANAPFEKASLNKSPTTQTIQPITIAAVENVPVLTGAEVSGHSLRIRLAAANQPAVALLKQGIEERVAQASAVAKNLKDGSLAIRFSNGRFNLNF